MRFVFIIPPFLMILLSACTNDHLIDKEVNTRTTAPVEITILDNTEYSLSVIDKKLKWGVWEKHPLSVVPKYNKNTFITRGTPTSGTEGYVEYSISEGSFKVHWDYTHWGKRRHYVEVNDRKRLYDIFCSGCNTNNFTIYVNQKIKPNSYNVLIMSDPQAWRLNATGNNPNKDKESWESTNKKISGSINLLDKSDNFVFGIVNGDITEFGRRSTRDSFDYIYTDNINFPLIIGLGNHDYANNVNDCSEGFDFSMNACARGAVFDLTNRIDSYKLFLSNFSSDYDKNTKSGSLGYSWDMGDIHFVQLNNYPTYAVELEHYAASTVHVTKSINWLEDDLRKSNARGKASIINFHDAYDHISKNTTREEKLRLEKMMKDYNVIALFSGHSHNASENGSYLQGVKNYNSGALFQGDYLKVEVDNKCIKVSLYNGFNGEPKKIKDFTGVCAS